ncbi:MAG TPA: molybdate ABC transporter substrate-binding protein [Actinomycetes bacterium]|jgi:molybdate transport system substrate-binding protein|nr:molybdate ABC transporter substrate-binding protein [Actinomycetes bacterium]
MHRRTTAATLLVGLAALTAGCGGSSGGTPAASGTSNTGLTGTITVLAASSLTESFTALGKTLEAQHPGTKVQFSFAASSELATQITGGAPADVFASASPATMQQVSDDGDAAGTPKVFVRNTLEIAVPSGNPAGVTGLRDFANKKLTIALCAPQVPCGAAATTVFRLAGITPHPDTLESDVKATLAKVTLGEVDAALVYKTDVKAAGGKVQGLDFPESAKAVNDYPIVVLKNAPNPKAGAAFVALVESPQGQKVLSDAGFQLP